MKVVKEDLEKLELYQKEKDKFYLLNLIAKTEGSLVYSDKNSYIIGRSREGLPTWIWTKDNISREEIKDLEDDLSYYLAKGNNKITCKKELYEILKKDYVTSDYFEMGYYTCKEVIKPERLNGIFLRPNYGDKMILSRMWIDNCKEMENEDVDESDALEVAEEWVEGKDVYVLKNHLGTIVAMAGYTCLDNTAKITHVFTRKEERGQGYCKSIMYHLTKSLLDENLKVMLYTNYNYEASNKAYKSVGYKDEGVLINFTIFK